MSEAATRRCILYHIAYLYGEERLTALAEMVIDLVALMYTDTEYLTGCYIEFPLAPRVALHRTDPITGEVHVVPGGGRPPRYATAEVAQAHLRRCCTAIASDSAIERRARLVATIVFGIVISPHAFVAFYTPSWLHDALGVLPPSGYMHDDGFRDLYAAAHEFSTAFGVNPELPGTRAALQAFAEDRIIESHAMCLFTERVLSALTHDAVFSPARKEFETYHTVLRLLVHLRRLRELHAVPGNAVV